MSEVYYKATLANGESASYHVPKIHYKLGLNVHPNPDKKSTDECGHGIHIANSITNALTYVPNFGYEVYECRPGLILGEGLNKVRCAYIWIDRQVSPAEIDAALAQKKAEAEKERKRAEAARIVVSIDATVANIMSSLSQGIEPLCGRDWLRQHALDVSQQDIDNLSLSVYTDKHKTTIINRMKKTDVRVVLGSV